MQRHKAVCLFLVAGAVLIVCTFGCNKGPSTPPLSSTPQKVVLRIWHTESNTAAHGVLEQIARDLTADYKDTKNVELDVRLEFIAWGNLLTRLQTSLQARDAPALTHLQPFMTRQLFLEDRLLPLDDVIATVESDNGPILEAVRNLQEYDDRHYGLAYAVGTTYFAYRRDWSMQAGYTDDLPGTWQEFTDFVAALNKVAVENGAEGAVGLPGQSSFFMDQLFVELCGTANASLWERPSFRPTIDSSEVRAVITFARALRPYLFPDWQSTDYLDQFDLLRDGRVAIVPVTYGRASLILEDASNGIAGNDEYFAVMRQPSATSAGKSIATIDCENWALLKGQDEAQVEAAKEFLTRFYDKKYYPTFCCSVPLHLTPIFPKVATSQQYYESDAVKDWRTRWQSWYDESNAMLREGRTSPILMASPRDKDVPFLLDIQRSRVFSALLASALKEDDFDVERALNEAQERAEQVWNRSRR